MRVPTYHVTDSGTSHSYLVIYCIGRPSVYGTQGYGGVAMDARVWRCINQLASLTT